MPSADDARFPAMGFFSVDPSSQSEWLNAHVSGGSPAIARLIELNVGSGWVPRLLEVWASWADALPPLGIMSWSIALIGGKEWDR